MQRPNSLLILGILNLFFGVFGAFGLLGSAAILVGMNPSNPMNAVLEASAFYRVYLWSSFLLGFIGIGILVASGIGFITSKAFARPAAIGYAIYAIVMGLIGQVINAVFVVGPLLENASSHGGPAAIGAVGGAIGGMFGGCIGLVYPIVLLVFMMRKNVVEYFTWLKQGSPAVEQQSQ